MVGRRSLRVGLGAIVTVLGSCAPAMATISQQLFVSANNKLYYVVAANPSPGNVGAQVTSVVMSSGTAIVVNETTNNPPDPVVTAFATFLLGDFLNYPPLSNTLRTEILTNLPSNDIVDLGNPIDGTFDPHANGGNGLLTLPGGTRTVTFDGSGTEAVVPVTTTGGAGVTLVPAVTVTTASRRLGAVILSNLSTLVFPNPPGAVVTSNGATCVGGTAPGELCDPSNGDADCGGGGTCTNFGGEAPGQNVTLDDTLGSRVGNPTSQGGQTDGFFIPNRSAVIVFMVDAGRSLGLSTSGFDVTGTCSNAATACDADADCPGGTCTTALEQRNVLNAAGDVDNAELPPPPTSSPSQTPTITPTIGATSTATSFNSRRPIPLVPSPISPSGLVLMGALAIALAWALRRQSS